MYKLYVKRSYESKYYHGDDHYCRELLLADIHSCHRSDNIRLSFPICYNEKITKEIIDKIDPRIELDHKNEYIYFIRDISTKPKISLLLYLLTREGALTINNDETVDWKNLQVVRGNFDDTITTALHTMYGLKLHLDNSFDLNDRQYDSGFNGIVSSLRYFLSVNINVFGKDFIEFMEKNLIDPYTITIHYKRYNDPSNWGQAKTILFLNNSDEEIKLEW